MHTDITVARSVYQWFPLTENWIQGQVEWQRRYRSIVLTTGLTESYLNFDELFVSEKLSIIPRFANKVLRRLTQSDFFKDNDKLSDRYKELFNGYNAW